MLRPSKTTGDLHQLPHLREVRLAELVPLGDDGQRVGAGQRVVALVAERDAVAEDAAAPSWSPPDRRRGRSRPAASSPSMITIAGASRMSSVRGLNASPQTAIVLPFQAAEVRLHLGDQPLLLRVVDRLDRVQNLEVVAVVARRLEQRLHVFGKAAAAVADAGKQERRCRSGGPTRSPSAPDRRRRRPARRRSRSRS